MLITAHASGRKEQEEDRENREKGEGRKISSLTAYVNCSPPSARRGQPIPMGSKGKMVRFVGRVLCAGDDKIIGSLSGWLFDAKVGCEPVADLAQGAKAYSEYSGSVFQWRKMDALRERSHSVLNARRCAQSAP